MHALRYAFDEAVASLWRGRQSGLLSTATIAVALFVLGVFLLATSNLERLSRDWSRTAERFKQTFADLATQTDALDGNPMPASYEVRLNPSVAAAEPVEELAAKLRQSPGVADVRYDREWLDRLLSAVTVIRGVGLALSAVLTIAAALTVANVVRLALHARRDEVEIMQLVGAPTVYIRGPFVMEGVLQGGIGAIVALVLLAALFLAVRGQYLTPLAATLNLAPVGFLPLQLCAMLLLGGMTVGCIGGLVAARRT
jgi:cell division transport system permease protein